MEKLRRICLALLLLLAVLWGVGGTLAADPAGFDAPVTLQSAAELPDVDASTPPSERVVVVYHDDGDMADLNLNRNDISRATKLSDSVDILTPANAEKAGEFARALNQNAAVETAFVDTNVPCSALPNDYELAQVNGGVRADCILTQTGAVNTWNQLPDGSPVKVAVIDTGCDTLHPEFAGRAAEVNDLFGKLEGNAAYAGSEASYHGTEVSGILGAAANNGIGIAGVTGTANVTIVPYRTGGKALGDANLSLGCIISALKDIAERDDIRVVNMSFGLEDTPENKTAIALINTYVKTCVERNIVMVASAGNHGRTSDNLMYPAATDGVIGVGGVVCASNNTTGDTDVSHWEGSPANTSVDIVAPAKNIYTTYVYSPENQFANYTVDTGTSFSAPVIAGEAAMLLSADPSLTASQVSDIILKTARDMGESGRDDIYGHGLAQFDAALAEVRPQKPEPTPSANACGQALTWQIKGRQLIISGDGAMFDYDEGTAPWAGSASKIDTIVLSPDITAIGNHAFEDMTALKTLLIADQALNTEQSSSSNALPSGLKSIGENAFAGCTGLARLMIPKSVSLIGSDAFERCRELTLHGDKGSAAERYAKQTGINFEAESDDIVAPAVQYASYQSTSGWQLARADGGISGSIGLNRSLSFIRVRLSDTAYGEIAYRTYTQNGGWENDYRRDAVNSGKSGDVIQAIKIKLSGELADQYDVYYQVNVTSMGWMAWAKNDEPCGITGYPYGVQAYRVLLVPKGDKAPENEPGTMNTAFSEAKVLYTTHVQNIGWQSNVWDGMTAGTSGKSLRLEAMRLSLSEPKYSGNICYRTHIQNLGWESTFRNNGEDSGTSGLGYRLEAMQVKLTGEMAEHYDVFYRVHAQNVGWMAWAKNGENAGTEGFGYRLEGMQVVIVEKGKTPPITEPAASTTFAYLKK